MPSRAAHSKSRSGCLRCKQRRVKCDEGRPCRDCHRRGERCSLVTDPSYIEKFLNAQASSPALSASPAVSTGSASIPSPPQHNLFAFLPGSQGRFSPPTTSQSEWGDDLFLMNHWTSHTSKGLSDRESAREIFREAAPEMGRTSPYVDHAMLSLSATHLSRKRPEESEKYLAMSAKHQQHALQQYQATLKNVTPENCTAVFLTASLLSVMSMSTLSQPKRVPDGDSRSHHISIDDIVSFFLMTRGVRDILQPLWSWLIDTRLTSLLHNYTIGEYKDYRLPEDFQKVLISLQEDVVPKYAGYHEVSAEACQLAILELEYNFKDLFHYPLENQALFDKDFDFRKRKDLELGVLMKWTTNVNAAFVNLLRTRNVAALVILAHWAVLFKHLGDKWFLSGWRENALDLISEVLKEEDQKWLTWPKEYMERPES